MNINPIKAAIAPYTFYLKLALLALLFVGGTLTGCHCQSTRNDKEVAALTTERDGYKEQATASASALTEVNRQTEANKIAAREQKERADAATEEATKQKRLLAQREDAWKKEYERLKKTPDCKNLLEQKLCPALRNY